ncbi:MAG: hypothetical protein MUC91_14770 [Verrucomicrobia bacterium]|nr:hypothetical protein [Verrucomicrobiota bacterium]
MKRLGIIALTLAVFAAVAWWLLSRPRGEARVALEETRRILRAEGFRTDLTDFNFATSRDVQRRMSALTNLLALIRNPDDAEAARRMAGTHEQPELMAGVGADCAVVTWKLDRLTTRSGEDAWPIVREEMIEHQSLIDPACEVALSGAICFHLDAKAGHRVLLPHLAGLKEVTRILSQRALLELHDGNSLAAWTNLLGATRLVSNYQPRPLEICHLVRCACATIAYEGTWQILQAGG